MSILRGFSHYNELAAGPNVRAVFNRSNTGIMGSNPARDMDVLPRFSLLYCPV